MIEIATKDSGLINPCIANSGEEKKKWDIIFLEFPEACSIIIKALDMVKKNSDDCRSIISKYPRSEHSLRNYTNAIKHSNDLFSDLLDNLYVEEEIIDKISKGQ